MTVRDTVTEDGRTWSLERAWPRGTGQVLCDFSGPDGERVAGRWFADAGEAAHEARRIEGLGRSDDGHVVLHHGGRDRRLEGLADAVAGGGVLIAHRPGRRAVVRAASGRYLKFVRASKVSELTSAHAAFTHALAGVARTPRVVGVTPTCVELAPLPGVPPLELVGDVTLWTDAWRRIGTVVAALAGSATTRIDLTAERPVHDASAEAAVATSWADRAVDAGHLPSADHAAAVADLVAVPGEPRALCHRDLHDGQLLIDDDGVGVLDPDTLAWAEPALDLANLLVHLDLRVAQGLLSGRLAEVAAATLIEAAAPDEHVLARLAPHQRACRLRLAGVYAFRPRYRGLARAWHREVMAGARGAGLVGADG